MLYLSAPKNQSISFFSNEQDTKLQRKHPTVPLNHNVIGKRPSSVILVFNQLEFHISFVSGTCECDEGFGAKDCSMDLNKPPVVYGVNIEEGGLCDKRTCQRALVEGYGFLNMETLKCSLTVFQVNLAVYHLRVCTNISFWNIPP